MHEHGNFNRTLGGTDWYSPIIVLGGRTVSIHVQIANTDLVGTLYLQCTNFTDDSASWKPCHFEDETGALKNAIAVSSGALINKLLIIRDNFPVNAVRLFWDAISGSGELVTKTVKGSRNR